MGFRIPYINLKHNSRPEDEEICDDDKYVMFEDRIRESVQCQAYFLYPFKIFNDYSLCQVAVGDTAARHGGHWQAGHGGEGT